MIGAAARGAWRELEATLRPFVARRVRRGEDVDDVLQDVFVRILRGLPGLRDEERFGPWVHRVARSAIVDHLRRAAKHRVVDGPSRDAALPDVQEEERAIEPEIASCAASFVARLPSPYREAVTLTELEGLTQQQAADMIGISLSGMKSRVQRGRRHLRRALEDCCEVALDARGSAMSCERRGRSDARVAAPRRARGTGVEASLDVRGAT